MASPPLLTSSPVLSSTSSLPLNDESPSILSLLDQCERLMKPNPKIITVDLEVDLTKFGNCFEPLVSDAPWKGGKIRLSSATQSLSLNKAIITAHQTRSLILVKYEHESDNIWEIFKVIMQATSDTQDTQVLFLDAGIFVDGTDWSSYCFRIPKSRNIYSFELGVKVENGSIPIWITLPEKDSKSEEATTMIRTVFELVRRIALAPEGPVCNEARRNFENNAPLISLKRRRSF